MIFCFGNYNYDKVEGEFGGRGMDSDDQNSDESSHDIAFGENDTENNETEIEDTTPSIQGESEEHIGQRNVHAKRQRLEDEVEVGVGVEAEAEAEVGVGVGVV